MKTFVRTAVRTAASASALSVLLAMTACGGGGGSGNPPISVGFTTSPPTSMALGATASIAALVSDDPSNGGVNWTVTCGAADCGSFSPTSTATGSPTTYTAPIHAPNPAAVTIVASAASGGAQISSTVAIAAPAAPLLADGTYVYHLSGQDGAGPYTVSGAFTVAGGAITGGEQDFSDPNAGYTDSLVPATSTVTAAGNNIQIALDTGNPAIGVNGVETLRATAVSGSRLLVSEFDITATGTGSLDLQTSTAAPAAGYAFAVSGTDVNGNALAIGGVVKVDGTTVDIANSVFDINVLNAGTNTTAGLQAQAFQAGSMTAPDEFGRVVLTLTPSAASGVPQFALAGYIVSPGRIQLVESAEAGDLLNANTGGAALGQGANTGAFNLASPSVANQSYAHGTSGVDINGNATMAGGFALNAGGVLGGTLAVNDLTNIGAWGIGGTYTVDPTGRVTLSITSLNSQTALPPANAMTFELYLDGNGNAMVLGADGFQTTQGIAFEQGSGFNLAGNYALAAQGAQAIAGVPTWSAVGPVAVSAGNFSGSTDFSSSASTPQSAVALGGTQDTARGLLQLAGLDASNLSATTGFGYYPVSGNRLWAIQVDAQGASLLLMEGVTR
jgi:hypothetical protein